MTKTARQGHGVDNRGGFCAYLREQREARELSLRDIAQVTRIPTLSLERLEAGEFEKLPADVFVRGFLRSYAQCVGLDVDETVRRYARCGLDPAPVASSMADEVLRQIKETGEGAVSPRRRMARGSVTPQDAVSSPVRAVASELTKWMRGAQAKPAGERPQEAAQPAAVKEDASDDGVVVRRRQVRKVVSQRTRDSERDAAPPRARARTFLPQTFIDEEAESNRGGLTLAVIILVIVATLTMSYLLRRPSHSGDGITLNTADSVETEPVA